VTRHLSLLLAVAIATLPSVAEAQTSTTAGAKTPAQTSKPRVTSDAASRQDPTGMARESMYARRNAQLDSLWPVKGPEPLPGAILPEKRIIAYYGDGKYRARMGDSLVERVARWAESRKALVFLDVQVGLSTLQQELPRLAKFLVRPNFHLGIDPEFSMKDGGIPGKRIGTFDAADINYATEFLQGLVVQHKLPPKLLIVHRFTRKGVTNYRNIMLRPEVQIVMHMDGFGAPWLKLDSYREYVKAEPVQFAGWKQFYKPKNDNPRTPISTIAKLNPKVLYIQYQ